MHHVLLGGHLTKRVRLEIYRDGMAEWRWRLIARNGRRVADSGEGYGTARKAINAARALSKFASMAWMEVTYV